MARPSDANKLPGWIVAWFYATGLICIWDASFVILRPLTLPGGSLHMFFMPYKYYIAVDQRYMDDTDSYSYTQSWLNYAEVLINFYTIFLHYKNARSTKLWAFTVSVLTFWKTVLYLLMFLELAGGQDYRKGNTLLQEIFLVWCTNGVWIIIPFMCMVALWSDLVGKPETNGSSTSKRTKKTR